MAAPTRFAVNDPGLPLAAPPLATVSCFGATDYSRAIEATHAAFTTFRSTIPADLLQGMYVQMVAHEDDLV